MSSLIEWILHVDRHLRELMEAIGPGWLYLVLAVIVFCETGLVVTPFLPGDSLLFAVGALCAIEGSPLSLWVMLPLLCFAAIAGDAVNYWIGNYLGPRVFRSETSRWFNKNHLLRAQAFYDRYGSKAIVLARFIPIVRTFAPFVAGIGRMNFLRFWFYNIVGGVVWVTLFLVAGYWMGTWEIVQKNFFLVTIGIIFVSLLPVAWEWYQARRESRA
ncbi:MAG: DedA family protein [Planctomycetes bacterium]|jgi:membrane-associated protein|nr:DedA family protein [Planctomycetota bacterium]